MGLLDDTYAKAKALAGLLSDAYQTGAQAYFPNEQDVKARPELAKGLLQFVPGPGDAISGYDAVQSAKQGNYGEAALNGIGLLPFVPAMGGMVRGSKTVPIMSWAEWQKNFPNISANESHAMWKSQASNQVEGAAKQLVDKLNGIGVKAQKSDPYAYENAIGGLSAYNYVPGYGEVRISDHLRSSGLGENHTFGNAEDAFNAIKSEYAASLSKQKQRDLLRQELGIGQNPQENIAAINKYIADNNLSGLEKNLGTWIDRLGLEVGRLNPRRYLPTE